MTEVSLLRLHVLRAFYLLIAVSEGSQIWPAIIHHIKPRELMHGVAMSMLAALTAVAVVGLHYPLRMLPLLFFQIA